MFLLYRLVGPASLVGLGVMIAVMPINASILLHLRKLQEGNMKSKDQRVRQVRPCPAIRSLGCSAGRVRFVRGEGRGVST